VVGRAESHSALGRLFSPGTVADLVRNAPCDVLVSGRAPATGRIVVGTDLAEPSLPILRAAADEQNRRPVTVYAVHCIHEGPGQVEAAGDLESRLAAASEAVGLRAVPQLLTEDPAKGLLDIAKELCADLIIVGSHGEAGIARLLLGSVAQDVVEDASCPVLVVRQPDAPH
jgi:nucleotide-binding universal stress UspA family protein